MDSEGKATISRAQFTPPNMDKKGAGIVVRQPCSFALKYAILRRHCPIINLHIVNHPGPETACFEVATGANPQAI
jgi:hypothetical protein